VGDRLIVHFKNELDEGTTIHWHGIRVPIEMDGVPGISQPRGVRGESFTYDFVVPDAGSTGITRTSVGRAGGLRALRPLLVEDPDDDVGVADELTIVLSDIGFDARASSSRPIPAARPAWCSAARATTCSSTAACMPTMRVRAGVPQRWRIVNTAKSRFFFLDLDGQPFIKIGSDGGLQEYTETRTWCSSPPANAWT
jgi:FtsP/CotA-like multicopper oxidase with cupredoxin domain